MFARRIIPLVVASLVAATVVAESSLAATHPHKVHATPRRNDQKDHFAAAPLLDQSCSLLEGQFDRDIAGKARAPLAGDARMLRVEGGADCGNGDPQAGRQRLARALRDIGETPNFTAVQPSGNGAVSAGSPSPS